MMYKTSIILLLIIFGGILPNAVNAGEVTTRNAIQAPAQLADLVKSKCRNVAVQPAPGTIPELRIYVAEVDEDREHIPLVYIDPLPGVPGNAQYYSCPQDVFSQIQLGKGTTTLDKVTELLISAFSFILNWIDWVLKWFLWVAGRMMLTMISQDKFITNTIVTAAWPFVQGLANLGFIFALLYIALATTLRLESVTVSVQRLLPKLLIAALLVNFSLVIGGLLIDASRLFMAVEINMMGGGEVNLENFSAKLLEKSELIGTQVAALETPFSSDNTSAILLRLIQNTLFILLMTIAMGIIAVNLFIRYIALLILLILSPLAYLAIALPQTQGIVRQWWGVFLKWVLYGPIVLFFLIIITRIQNIDVVLSDKGAHSEFFATLAHFLIVIALFFVANSVGKKLAGVGSDAVMSFAKKNPRTALLAGTAVATGGLAVPLAAVAGYGAGKYAAKGGANIAKDLYKGVGANLKQSKVVKPVREFLGAGKRDKDGNLLPGKSSIGSSAAGALTDRFNTSKQKDIAAVKALGNIDKTNVNNVALAPSQLKKSHVASTLGATKIQAIIKEGSQAQRTALVSNADYIGSLNSSQMMELQKTIQEAPYTAAEHAVKSADGNIMKPAVLESGVSNRDKAQLIDQLLKTVDTKKK